MTLKVHRKLVQKNAFVISNRRGSASKPIPSKWHKRSARNRGDNTTTRQDDFNSAKFRNNRSLESFWMHSCKSREQLNVFPQRFPTVCKYMIWMFWFQDVSYSAICSHRSHMHSDQFHDFTASQATWFNYLNC